MGRVSAASVQSRIKVAVVCQSIELLNMAMGVFWKREVNPRTFLTFCGDPPVYFCNMILRRSHKNRGIFSWCWNRFVKILSAHLSTSVVSSTCAVTHSHILLAYV